MKKFLALLSITIFFLGNVYAQQKKVYILIDAKYTKKLTYEYESSLVGALNKQSSATKEKKGIFECYSFPEEGNITAYFKISKNKKGEQFTKLPANTIKPKNRDLNTTLINNVIYLRQKAYLLKRTSKGYDSYIVEGASYIKETPEYIAYSNSEGVYEIKKGSMQGSYTPALASTLKNKLNVSHRIEGNRIIGYKIETSNKQSLELIPGLGLRSETQQSKRLKTVQLKYVNQFTAKDYLYRLKGDPIQTVASASERNTTVQAEPIAGSSRTRGKAEAFSNTDFFAEAPKAVIVQPEMEKGPMQPIASQRTLEGTPFNVVASEPKVQSNSQIQKGYHRVVDGDNLYAISRKFKIPVKRLMALNKLSSYNINVNQQLKVVDDGSIVSSMNPTLAERQETNSKIKNYIYSVEQDDTLFSIATKFKTTIANLCILNKIEDINHALNIDDELIIRQSIVSE